MLARAVVLYLSKPYTNSALSVHGTVIPVDGGILSGIASLSD